MFNTYEFYVISSRAHIFFTIINLITYMHFLIQQASFQKWTLCSMQQPNSSVRYTEKPRYSATDCPPQFVAVFQEWRRLKYCIIGNPCGRVFYGVGLRLGTCRIESLSATGRSSAQNSTVEWCVWVCDLVTSSSKRPRSEWGWYWTTTLRHTGHLTTLYDKPQYRSVFSRNPDGTRSSLKMAAYCRNM
jgi:hypothetical protein